MKKNLFLGLGHLGNHFVAKNRNYLITGTMRNPSLIEGAAILPYTLGEEWSHRTDFDIVIVSFPPQKNYAKMLEDLLHNFNCAKIIFVSSTSIYGPGLISELSPPSPQTDNANELVKSEEVIKKLNQYLIIRPGGLIDEKRHPRNFLQKSRTIKKAKTQVNLVHTADIASFLHFAIEKGLHNEDFNLVCDDHPSKEEFYKKLNTELIFENEGSEDRIISNSKSKNFGFNYQYPSLEWTKV